MVAFHRVVAKLLILRLPVAVLALLGVAGFAVGLLVAQPPSPQALAEPAPAAAVAAAPDLAAGLVELPDQRAFDPKLYLVPSCTLTEYQARRSELSDLYSDTTRSGGDPAAVLAELRLVLSRPCLRHVPAMSPLPADASRLTLHALVDFIPTLESAMILESDDKGLIATIPAELALELDGAARAKLEPFLCRDEDKNECGHTRGYQMRASQDFFNARITAENELREPPAPQARVGESPPLAASLCAASSSYDSFDAWSACAAARTPREIVQSASTLFELAPRLRPVERGWILLYFHNGMSSSESSLTAYDVATGAFYSATSSSPCEGPDSTTLRTGTVSVEAVRELAFALATRPALRARRTDAQRARVPDGVKLRSAPSSAASAPVPVEPLARDTAFAITYRYVDGPFHVQGAFSHFEPGPDGIDVNVAALASVVEAGAVPGCAPAALPPGQLLLFQDLPVERLDSIGLYAEAWQWHLGKDGLAPHLESLRAKPCLATQRIVSKRHSY